MTTRRDVLQIGAATAAVIAAAGLGPVARALAQQRLTEAELLAFEPLGNVTLIHLTDLHAQLVPVHFREPDLNVGVGEARGAVPHLTGAALLARYGIPAGSAMAHALAPADFAALARGYGRMGGLDRIAAIVARIRAERPGRCLLLDGGDTWQGSYTALQTRGGDMVEAMRLLSPDAMTGHWEFTYGAERLTELVDGLGMPFLGLNVRDTEWDDAVFPDDAVFERGGVKVAVLGQAFPYTPIANPRHFVPDWAFGIREEEIARRVEAARAGGAALVVLLSHNGFDVDRKLAARVPGIDVILTGHTHDALPEPVVVGRTLLVASGSHGKFVSRLDLDVGGDGVRGFRHRLIPVFSDVIAPEPAMAAKIAEIRAPHEARLGEVLGTTETLLYRRGNLNGTFDDLICNALMQERDAEIALSPGFRWGASVLPGEAITAEAVFNQCAITYPAVYRMEMTGETLKTILEDVADNLFNPDPYYQQGGDMVRVGGLGYRLDVGAAMGSRISELTLTRTAEPVEPGRSYSVAGWASVNPDVEGPPIWDVVSDHIRSEKTIRIAPSDAVKLVGG